MGAHDVRAGRDNSYSSVISDHYAEWLCHRRRRASRGTAPGSLDVVSGPALPALSTPDCPTTDVTFSEAGNYVFRLTADDGAITRLLTRSSVRVDGVNRPPIITSLPATTGLTTRAYSYNVTAIDPDPNDTVRFALRTAPVGMVIDPDSGLDPGLRFRVKLAPGR